MQQQHNHGLQDFQLIM